MSSHVTGMGPAEADASNLRTETSRLLSAPLAASADWRELPLEQLHELRARIFEQPGERWSEDPDALLLLAAGHRYTTSPNPFTALAILDAADALLGGHDSAEASVLSRLLRAGNLRALGRIEDALAATATAEDAARSARIALPAAIELQAAAMVERGICLTLLGRLDEAHARLTHGMGLESSRWHPAARVEGLGCFALLEFLLGHPVAARALVSRAEAQAEDAGLRGHLSTAPFLVVATMMELEAGRTDAADGLADAVRRAAAGSEYEPLGHLVRASGSAARARWRDALDALQDMQLALRGWENPGLLQSLHDAERAGVLITQGEGGPARQLVDRLRGDEHHALCPERLLARLEIAAGDFTAALEATEACVALGDDHAPRTQVYVDVLRAAAHDGLGDAHAAAAAFDRALDAAGRNDARRAFAGIPPERLGRLLADARSRSLPPHSAGLLQQLAAEFPAEQSGAEFLSPLSARERIVLKHIIAGHSARQISAQLRVSPNTVKTQVRSVYRKLGASNRHEAVERARSFGLRG